MRLVLTGEDGERVLETDHVLAGTGFKVDLDRLGFLDEDIRGEVRTHAGYPVLDGRFASSVAGLHFVGLPAALTFGPGQRFVWGSRAASQRVSAALAERSMPRPSPARVFAPSASSASKG